MLIQDVVLIFALYAFVVAWWGAVGPSRAALLAVTACTALVVGVWSVFDARWQAIAGCIAATIFMVALLLSRGRRRGVPYVTGTLLALLLIPPSLLLYLFPVSTLPKPSGEYQVGVRTFELVDVSRRGVFSAAADEPRRLLVRVWYPAKPSAAAQPSRYFSPAEAHSTAHGLGELVRFAPLLSHLKHVRTNGYENAPLVPAAGKRPMVVYGHGLMSYLGQQTVLMEELASHGYIVYSIQHTYDASDTVFPNGDVVPMDVQLKRGFDAERPQGMRMLLMGQTYDERLVGHLLLPEQDARLVRQSAAVWVQDRQFLLDRLAANQVPEELQAIASASDTSQTGQIGMSFGGSTTGGFCMVDRRCVAGVNLDGLSYHLQTLNAEMPVPFLLLHSDLARFERAAGGAASDVAPDFNQFSYQRFANAGQAPHVYRFQVRQMLHMGFSDLSLFIRKPLRDRFLGTASTHTMLGVQKDVVREFFDRYLRNVDNGFPMSLLDRYGAQLTSLDNAGVRTWWQGKTPEERQALQAQITAVQTAAQGSAQ